MARNFITNAKQKSLKSRIHELVKHSSELKFLVGFFYFSGWRELYEALKKRDDLGLKILVGLDTDLHHDQVLELADPKAANAATRDLVERYYTSLRTALRDKRLDTKEFYEQVSFFLQLLKDGRLQIRKTFEPNHAKLYLFKLGSAGQELVNAPGRFITGSSNLTRAGLLGQHEFNVEIGDYGWDEAEQYFDELWQNSLPLSEDPERKNEIVHILERETPIAEITPFEAYALVLKTYLDLVEQKQLKPHVKRLMEARGYRIYRYQEEAVQQALTVLDEYGGVILADVVGLGKSVIASWLARERNGRGIVICPPDLIGDRETRKSGWHKYLSDFDLHDWEVFSVGALDKVLEYLSEYGGDITTVIVDEAHRFRNEDTEAYERLSRICLNRDVILLTATPFNNAPSDIFALLKLFIPPGQSTLTLDEKLAARFARYSSDFRKLSYILRYHAAGGEKQKRAEKYYRDLFDEEPPIRLDAVQRRVRNLADEIRSVIEPVTIRRNRLDLTKDPIYSQEVADLPRVADPIELFYDLTDEQLKFYDRVINVYFGEDGLFRGAIYQPYAYEKKKQGAKLEEEFTYQQQRNLFEFMRRLLVKRFESSFGAFAKSINNFVRTHEAVLQFIENSKGKYILDRKLLEKVYEADEDEINEALEAFIRKLGTKEKLHPTHDRVYEIDKFDDPEGFIKDIEADLELLRRIAQEIKKLKLVDQDPKAKKLIQALREILEKRDNPNEPKRKVVIFSEYVDTVESIKPALKAAWGDRVMVAVGALGKSTYEALLCNFDASYKGEQCDAYDILLTTDKLSEGVNLNRAGAVINYDIPWNPTRVIQRLGRINRIGKKVYDTLYIYNFFPTQKGADVIKSREIAAQKMFLIHNTLGEDAKIFEPGEVPSPSGLFQRINRNPEELEEESLLTRVRKAYFAIKEKHPDVVSTLDRLSPRVKTAKPFDQDELLVFRRKALQLFVHAKARESNESEDNGKPEPAEITFEQALPRVECSYDTPRLPLSNRFWADYEEIKRYRKHTPTPPSEASLQAKAENNLRSVLEKHEAALGELSSFVKVLLRDLKEYQTLPKYTLRRLSAHEMKPDASKRTIEEFIKILVSLKRSLGGDYLDRIEEKARAIKSEIIIAIENIAINSQRNSVDDPR